MCLLGGYVFPHGKVKKDILEYRSRKVHRNCGLADEQVRRPRVKHVNEGFSILFGGLTLSGNRPGGDLRVSNGTGTNSASVLLPVCQELEID